MFAPEIDACGCHSTNPCASHLIPDFDAMTNLEFEGHPDCGAKRDYIASVYRAALRPVVHHDDKSAS